MITDMAKNRMQTVPHRENRGRRRRAFLLAAGIAVLLLPLLLLASAGRTYAAGFDVYDHEDLLTDAEEQDLARRYEDFCEKHGYRMFLLTAGSDDAFFQIYSITGQMLKQLKVNAETHVTVEMPKGFYIVKYNNQWSRKVVVN